MDPLLSLGTLSSNIEHAVGEVSNDEGCFGDTRGLDTGAKDILIVWHVIMLSDSLDVIKVARQRVLGSALFTRNFDRFSEMYPQSNTYYLAESFN